MTAEKKREIKDGDQIVASLQTLSNTNKIDKLVNRTKLTKEELSQPMRVLKTQGTQAKIKHPRLEHPFEAHVKFFEHAPAAQ